MRYRENGTAGRPRRSAPDAADRKPRDGTCSCCRGFFGMSATASGTPKQDHPRNFSRRLHRGDRGPCPTSPSLKLRSVADDRRCTKAEPVCRLTSETSWCEILNFASKRMAVGTLLPSVFRGVQWWSRRRSAPLGRSRHGLRRGLEADLGVGTVAERLLRRCAAAAEPDLALGR